MEHAHPSPSINRENWERSSTLPEFCMPEGIYTIPSKPGNALSVLGSRIEELAALQKQLTSELYITRNEFEVKEVEHNALKANNEYLYRESAKYTAQIRTMIFALRNSIVGELSSLHEFKREMYAALRTEMDMDYGPVKKTLLRILERKLDSNMVGVETDCVRQDALIHSVISRLVPIIKGLDELKADLKKFTSVQRQNSLNAMCFEWKDIGIKHILEKVNKENDVTMTRLMNLVHRMRELKISIAPDVFPNTSSIPILLAKIESKISMLYRGLLSKMAILLREREQVRREVQVLNVELERTKASLLKTDESLQNYVQENTSLIIENGRLRMEMQNSRAKTEAELGELHAKNRELQRHLDHAERQLADIPPVKRARTQPETLTTSRRILVEPIPCELAEIQNLRLDSNATTGKEPQTFRRTVTVAFSGIRDPSLRMALESLDAKIHSGEPFDEHVLHSSGSYNF